jgi:pimeloyl-ACP methyl ester carboxylesterase
VEPSIPLDLLHDFGGDGPVTHLAHANGFPPATYTPLAETLIHPPGASPTIGHGYHVVGMPARPLWPGSQPESAPTWHVMADDLMHALDGLGLRTIVGIGHSMGGVFTLLAAIQRPDLFRALVLIDPVIMPPNWLRGLRWMRKLGLSQRQPLVQGALRRRRIWPDRKACYARYRNKRLFKQWPDASLHAYVDAVLQPRRDGQFELIYPPEWEAHIFATSPVDVWDHVPELGSAAAARTLVIRGEHTNTFRPGSQALMEHLLPEARFHVIPNAGHLVPMERPAETGTVIREFLAKVI